MNTNNNDSDNDYIRPDGEFPPPNFQGVAKEDSEVRVDFEKVLTEEEHELLHQGPGCIVQSKNPTEETTDELVFAFNFFNTVFFGGELPDCHITLQREKSTAGFYSPERFVNEEERVIDEIALNPSLFTAGTTGEVLSTLLHEMVHHWQHHFGEPGRGRYHNREWTDKMESLGLMPSDTGRPGGKRTGDSMSDYVLEGGGFDRVSGYMIKQGFTITWSDKKTADFLSDPFAIQIAESGSVSEPKGNGRSKFSCPCCGQNAWAKPGAQLICGKCFQPLLNQDRPDLKALQSPQTLNQRNRRV